MHARIGWMTATLVTIAALTVLLGTEAVRTARTQRVTVERVLSDYASLGAEGIATRLQALVAGTFFPLLDQMPATAPGSVDALTTRLRENQLALARQVTWAGHLPATGPLRVVRYDQDSVGRTSEDEHLGDTLRAAARRLPQSAYFGLIAIGEQLVVFAAPLDSAAPSAVFALPRSAVAAWLTDFLQRAPALPAALTGDRALGERVTVTIVLAGKLLATRGTNSPSMFRGTQSLGPVFGDMTVEVRLLESLAPTLVIGGLPYSRLPFLGAVMMITIMLAALAIRQVRRRERLASERELFVAGASHELRTPLAQIRLFAETLQLGRVRTEDERAHAVGVVEREARRLEFLVDNLLSAARSGRGQLSVAPAPMDLAAVTREAVAEYAPLAKKALMEVRVDVPLMLPACVDRAAWRLIVLNLLDNGVKYGQGTEVLSVRLVADGAGSRLTVSDQGPGVPLAERELVWQRFWRGGAARVQGIPGTGVGLATVRHLVELMGGECWVERATPNGAQFVVRTPSGT